MIFQSDPVNYRDPFGLCPGVAGTNQKSITDCPGYWTGIGAMTGALLGGGVGGFGGGAAAAAACSPSIVGTVPCAAAGGAAGGALGAAKGAAAGAAFGAAVDAIAFFSKRDIQQINDVARRFRMGKEDRRDFGDFVEAEKAAGRGGTANGRGDFKFQELIEKAKEFLGLIP